MARFRGLAYLCIIVAFNFNLAMLRTQIAESTVLLRGLRWAVDQPGSGWEMPQFFNIIQYYLFVSLFNRGKNGPRGGAGKEVIAETGRLYTKQQAYSPLAGFQKTIWLSAVEQQFLVMNFIF